MEKEKKNVKLYEALGKVYMEEIKADLKREVAEPEYMRQVDFANCQSRAVGMSKNAVKRCQNVFAYAILKHREIEHNEDHTEEKKVLESQMSKEDIKLASTRGWWKP